MSGRSLATLEARFVRAAENEGLAHCESFLDAQGVLFLCPKCFTDNKGSVGTHSILVWFDERNVPTVLKPTPRWKAIGTSINDLTLTPSINLDVDGDGIRDPGECECLWHGFVTNGVAA